VRFDSAFTFKYSLREHTRAFRLGDSVSEQEKGQRLAALIAMQESIALERNLAAVGQVREVLVEGPARRGEGMLAGRTPQFKSAVFRARAGVAAGDTVRVRIDGATGHSLSASQV
jgi:tRNA-2-methylthio-N6-dimethylallyladenosine synthase